MSKKTINQALKDLFLGLGGDSKELEDNSSVSDYIADLESAIESLIPVIPEPELPSVTAEDNGKVLAVVNGAWTLCTPSAVADTTTGEVTITFTPDEAPDNVD